MMCDDWCEDELDEVFGERQCLGFFSLQDLMFLLFWFTFQWKWLRWRGNETKWHDKTVLDEEEIVTGAWFCCYQLGPFYSPGDIMWC